MSDKSLDHLCINTMRFLGVDAVQKAGNGHPGTAMWAAQMAYVLWEATENPDVILMGTGSEVHIALEAGKLLQDKGVSALVVSLPSWKIFQAQSSEYRNGVLPPDIRARVSIEAATTLRWERYVGTDDVAIGMSGFGASAPIDVLYEQFGITAHPMVDEATRLIKERQT